MARAQKRQLCEVYLKTLNVARRASLLLLIGASLFVRHPAALGQNESDVSKEEPKAEQDRSSKPLFFSPGFLIFGDVYGVPSHHLPQADDQVGAWIRRLYLTGDFNLTRQFFVRARLEVNQDGDFESNGFTADVKDLFLRWTIGKHRLLFGMSPTPTFDLIEDIWRYRFLEKTPLDLQGVPSRDWGIAANGPLSCDGMVRYRLMLGTGNELGRETGEGTKFMGAISVGDSKKGFLVDVYGDFQELPGRTDRSTGQLFVEYTFSQARLGGLYSYQDRQDDPRLVVASLFIESDSARDVTLIGRIDRLFAPSPKGNSIDYLPFDPDSKATFLIGGMEWRPHRFLSLAPNVEAIFYDRNGEGDQPRSDLLLRLTFYVHN